MNRGRPKGSGKFNKGFHVRMVDDDLKKLNDISRLTGVSSSEIIRLLIKDFIDRFVVYHF